MGVQPCDKLAQGVDMLVQMCFPGWYLWGARVQTDPKGSCSDIPIVSIVVPFLVNQVYG